MSIRFLVVEDDPSFLELIRSLIGDLGADIELTLARSRDAALAILKEECFDITILDLKIPTADENLDADVEHGRIVLHSMRELAPGTPVVVLTGSPAEGFISSFLERSDQVDIWGEQIKTPTVRFLRKSEIDRFFDVVSPSITALRSVRDVELRQTKGYNLTWAQDRLIRIFVRRRGGVSCSVFRISGGLSGAEVFRVAVADATGAPLLNAVLKVGSPDMVTREYTNYNRHAQRLDERATPRLIEDVRFGAGSFAAISYRMAESYTRTMFDLVREDPEQSAKVVSTASTFLAPWREGVPETRITIGDVRRRMLSDDKAARLFVKFNLGWARGCEGRQLQVRSCCIHGDLHGGNLLVDDSGMPILIDYGDIGEGPAALDWVTLELSALFHPDGCARESAWPSVEDCGNWADVAAFARASSIAPFLTACRHAAYEAGAGPREVAAAAYAYLLRQLSYEDTNKERALTLLQAVRRFIDNGT